MLILTALLLAFPAAQAESFARPPRRNRAERPAHERVEPAAPRRELRGEARIPPGGQVRRDRHLGHRLFSPRLRRLLAEHPRLRAELLQQLRDRPLEPRAPRFELRGSSRSRR